MKRRLIAAGTAVLLAAVGGLLLLNYVGAADARAMAGMQSTRVLVALSGIPEGTSGDDLRELVEVRQLPARAVAPGTTGTVADLRGLVSTTALEPGEQLLVSRFADPDVLEAAKGLVVPKGLHQLSLQLEPQRVVNGTLAPGATVGVFLSLEEPKRTELSLHTVLVTAVSGAPAAAVEGDDAPAAVAGPVTVTLAVRAADIAKVVFAAEHGTIWLSAEPAAAPTDRKPVTTEGNLYR